MARGAVVRAVVLAIAGCCPDVASVSPMDTPPPDAIEATKIARNALVELLDGRNDAPSATRVYWSDEIIIVDGIERYGWADSCLNMWVYWDGSERPSDTALTHELAHCFAGDIGQHCWTADNSHSDGAVWGPGGAVEVVVELLRDAGK